MTLRKKDIGSKDFISNLPDALIGHILSFLSTKEAALTSVLSKRWRYLLAFVSNLDFDAEDIDGYEEMNQLKRREIRTSFLNFVDRVLALQGKAPVNKFSLRFEIGVESSPIKRWIFNVLDRGVVDLSLYVSMELGYKLPSEVLMSKTLVKLKVVGTDDLTTKVEEFSLPKLKTLYLFDVGFNESGARFAKLISTCHVLEELVMNDVVFFHCEFFLISNQNLKRLKVSFHYDDARLERVAFDTPNVVYFEYYGIAAGKYPMVNFDSLVEAKLNLRIRHDDDESMEDLGNATDLFMGMCNVEILDLSASTLEVLAVCCKSVPVFNTLVHLTIHADEEMQWKSLPKLLENCPILETLVFEELRYKDTRANRKPWKSTRTCLSSSPVKMLKVWGFRHIYNFEEDNDDDIIKQTEVIKFLLETMPNLEQVMIYYDTLTDNNDLSILTTELEKLEKVASPACKIQVSPDNRFPCTDEPLSSPTFVFFKNRVSI